MVELLIWSLIVITWASYGLHVIKEYIRNTASGTAQPNLSAKTVGNYEINNSQN